MATLQCPICGVRFEMDSVAKEHLPFCGDRCKQVDLGRWLDERYSLPHEPSEDELEPEEY